MFGLIHFFFFPHVWVLTAPIFLSLLLLVAIIFFISRNYKYGLMLLSVGVLLNAMTETFAVSVPENINCESLTIMTYNTQSTSSVYMTQNRENPMGMSELIMKQTADIVCLQEYEGWYCDYLKRLLDQDYPYFVQMPDMPKESAVFSKYPIEDVKQIPGDLVMEMTINRKGRIIKLIVCHMASNRIDSINKELEGRAMWYERFGSYMDGINKAGEKRVDEVEKIKKRVKSCLSKGIPVVVCGDMNDVGGSKPLRILKSAGLKDAWWEKGLGFGFTYYGHQWMKFRLDHIMYSDALKCKSVKVVRQDFSDHNPIVAKFEL